MMSRCGQDPRDDYLADALLSLLARFRLRGRRLRQGQIRRRGRPSRARLRCGNLVRAGASGRQAGGSMRGSCGNGGGERRCRRAC